jgi:tripartite-type tricarboxylate transporter receptor subunit TctC
MEVEHKKAGTWEDCMRFPRRHFLQLAAGAAVLPAMPRLARAQSYPSRPVRWIVGFAAGGPQDIVARLLAQSLSERLGQQFVIENRAGAGGNIGTEAVVRAPADGYTMLMIGPSATINATLYDNLSFVFLRDIAPVASIIRTSNVMEVHPSFPAKTVPEFIAYAKANPGKINMASAGSGSSQHMAGELFKMMAGIEMVHVPYRGAAPALTDLLAGQVQIMFDNMTSSVEHVRAGRLRGLAVTTAARSEALPDLPIVGDFVRGYEASGIYGIGVPKDTPPDIVDKLNREINAALSDPRIKTRLADLGGLILSGTSADFAKVLAEEVEKWGKVVKFSGAKPG